MNWNIRPGSLGQWFAAIALDLFLGDEGADAWKAPSYHLRNGFLQGRDSNSGRDSLTQILKDRKWMRGKKVLTGLLATSNPGASFTPVSSTLHWTDLYWEEEKGLKHPTLYLYLASSTLHWTDLYRRGNCVCFQTLSTLNLVAFSDFNYFIFPNTLFKRKF